MSAGPFDGMQGCDGWRPDQQSPYFPDPWCDYASLAMPRSIAVKLLFCEFIFNSDGTLREAARRTLAYFITDVQIGGARGKRIGRDEQEKYASFFKEVLDINYALHCSGLDLLCYGNAFTSLVVPFERSLRCRGHKPDGYACGFEAPYRKVADNAKYYRYRWQNFEFHARCPFCGYQGAWDRVDRRTPGEAGYVIKRYRPHDIDILYDDATDAREYIWRIPEDYRQLIRDGRPHVLAGAPWEVVEAVKQSANLKFNKGVIHHMIEPTLAGVRSRGWGISRVMVNFRHAWYVKLLHRFNEAIAMDYIIPLRVVTPDPKSGPMLDGASDPLRTLDLGEWRGNVEAAISARRFDPMQWSFFPFPLQYQILGGEARQLAPFELLDQAISMELNNSGYPVEFFKLSLTTQSAIPGARLFQSNHTPLVHALNGFLRFYSNKVAEVMGWEPASASLVPPSYVDDIQDAAAKINLATQRLVSPSTALKSLNLDYKQEQSRIIDDERYVAELQGEAQKEMQQAGIMDEMASPPQQQAPGGMAGVPGLPNGQVGMDPAQAQGGAAGPNAAAAQSFQQSQPLDMNMPQTPTDIMSKADSLAQDLLSRTETERSSALMALKKQQPLLHPYVRQKLDEKRQQARTQGAAMVLGQQGGG